MAMYKLKRIQNDSFSDYKIDGYFDEMFNHRGFVRTPYESIYQRFSKMGIVELDNQNTFLKSQMIKQGITFTLHNEIPNESGSERVIPFDMIPRTLNIR